MRLHDKLVFVDKKKLDKMLTMRRSGWGYVNLGFMFGTDYSTIYYQCKKAGVKAEATHILKIDNIIKNVIAYPNTKITLKVR